MATSIKAFGSGVGESFNSLVNNGPVIILCVTVAAGVGYLTGGSPMAWLAAKVVGFIVGMIYALGHPSCVIEANICSPRNCHAVGNVVAALGIPLFLIHGVHLLLR